MKPVATLLAIAATATTLHAGDGPDAAATMTAWLSAVRTNQVAAAWDTLPASQRAALAATLAPPAADPAANGGRGGRGPGMGGPLRFLTGNGQMTQAGPLLANALALMTETVGPIGSATPAAVALPTEPPFLAFMPRMMAGIGPTMAMDGLLADGLETRQLAALATFGKGYATWAATAPLADEAKAAATQPHLEAIITALSGPTGGATVAATAREQMVTADTVLAEAKLALAVYGLDLDAALATATVKTETTLPDGAVIVVVTISSFGSSVALPLKMTPSHGGWAIAADSIALRWMGGGMGRGFPGGGPGGRGRNRGPGGPNGAPPEAPPAEPAPTRGTTQF